MPYKKTVLLINSLFLLFSILFLNLKKTPIVSNNNSVVDRAGVVATPEVLSQNSGVISYAKVIRVIDGDTIELDNGEKVRYIGINSPEMSDGGECFSTESTGKNSELVLGKTVQLEKDISDRDKYNRLLRYVYISKSNSESEEGKLIFVNELLVREGYANVSTYPPDVKYKDTFINAERRAREEGKGLWEECRVEKK